MIVVIDYGMGNLHSVAKALKRIHVDTKISSDAADISSAHKLILPGVGHYKREMENLRDLGIIDVLNKSVIDNKIPILGICLGMQLFTKHSEEGDVEGLGWLDAKTVKFSFENQTKFRIPHIGWNTIHMENKSPLFDNIKDSESFYFVHSYYVTCEIQVEITSHTEYGCRFTSSIAKENIFATQFHPEKSHDQGLAVLKNFIDKI